VSAVVLADPFVKLLFRLGVEPGGGLVEYQHL
jgi:hypothetical protein